MAYSEFLEDRISQILREKGVLFQVKKNDGWALLYG